MKQQIVVLGTGGTIAGTAESATDHTGYTAAQIGVQALLASVPGLDAALQGRKLLAEQVAQLDSKDMDFDTMLELARRCAYFLAQPQVKGIVITHGTDTLEETAYFLHGVIPLSLQAKPVVLTCAMRPATSSEADGPRNIVDAVRVACDAKARGVLVVCAGQVHHAVAVQKVHTYALNAFSSGDVARGESGAVAQVAHGQVLWNPVSQESYEKNTHFPDVGSTKLAINLIAISSTSRLTWPRVEIVLNHSHANGRIVRALIEQSRSDDPLRAIVVAATGNATVSHALADALLEAQSQGVAIVMSSRCHWGGIRGELGALGHPSQLPAVKARIAWVCQHAEATTP
jgi:L-asparaginase